MCGICGEIALNGEIVSLQYVEKMMQKMERRGPDTGGLHFQANFAFGHRRLKIIDLSERSQQPMVDNELGLSIVFNGTIYNYKELKQELTAKGYKFFSNGDTEVILKAYHAWGKKCLKRFNGMFAFAVHQRDTGKIFLARDRLGIKPLYYTNIKKNFYFASSLPALLEVHGVDTDIDPVALNYYMTFHAVVPAPRTILKGIKKLPPATSITLEPDGSIQTDIYWNFTFSPVSNEEQYEFEDWKILLENALRHAIKRRLVADVPVGVLLSGGVDSSLVVGMLAKAGQNKLSTFSIGFESVNNETGDEFQYSDIIAEHFGTEHHRIKVDAKKVLPVMNDCVKSMSEPMVSHDCIGFYLLSEEVSKSIKVVQSGQGADEIFGGYHWYPKLMESKNATDDYMAAFFDRNFDEYSNAVHPRFSETDYSKAFVETHFKEAGADRPIDKALRLDTKTMLVDDPVKRVDNMTMAWGLEARVPFLDHEVVEIAARIPPELKVKNGGKYILKYVARDIIPSAIIDRPKGYFPVPALKFFRGEYLDFVSEIFRQPEAKQRELFNMDYVTDLLKAPDNHITPLNGSKLWQIALLEYWMQIHRI